MSGLNEEFVRMLEEIRIKQEPVYLVGSKLDITFQTFLRTVTPNELELDNKVKPLWIHQFSESDKFFLQCRMLKLQTEKMVPAGVSMKFPIQANSVTHETRSEERLIFSPDEKVICEILNPYDGRTRVAKTVLDMSPSGLSIRTSVATKLFQSGTKFDELRILIDGKPYTQSAGRVVYSKKLMDHGGKLNVQVGIKLEPQESHG